MLLAILKNSKLNLFQLKMKSWQLTVVCTPLLKAVLRAVERTLLDSYGIDCNFLEIEEALTNFLEKLRQAKEEHGSLHELEPSERPYYHPDQH